MTILIVEDDPMNLDMLSRRLALRGYQILVAGTGLDGIAMAREHRPFVILMDLTLPVLSGWDAIRVLKTDASTKAIPIIALTAHAMSADRVQALDAGCDDFDTKPVVIETLLAKIQAVTNRHSADSNAKSGL